MISHDRQNGVLRIACYSHCVYDISRNYVFGRNACLSRDRFSCIAASLRCESEIVKSAGSVVRVIKYVFSIKCDLV